MEKEKETWRERLELWVYQKYNITIGADIIIILGMIFTSIILLFVVLLTGLLHNETIIESDYTGIYISSNEDFVEYRDGADYGNNIVVTDDVNSIDESILSNFSNTEFIEDTLYLSDGETEYNYAMDSVNFEYYTNEINLMSYYDFVKETNKNDGFYIFVNTDEIVKRPEYSKMIYSDISLNEYKNAKTVLYNNNDNINVMFKDLAVTNPPLFLIGYEDSEIVNYVDNLSYMPFVSNTEKCSDKEDAMYLTMSEINDFLTKYFTISMEIESEESLEAYCTADNYTPAEWNDIQELQGSETDE